MRILVVGADGMLGQDVVREFSEDHELSTSTLEGLGDAHALDMTRMEDVRRVIEQLKPDLVINCAAHTAVDRCEEEEELAFRINGEGPGNLARACAANDARLFHISTDYVFDGEKGEPYVEEDHPNPRSVYGSSKLAGERAVMESGCEYFMGRIQWLYGAGGPNFAETMLGLTEKCPSLKVVDDQRGCPTWTVEVARCMRRILELGEPGLYHMSARGETTWFGFTQALLRAAGKGDFPLEPCATEEFPRPAHRPRNSVLNNAHLARTIGDEMLPWDAAIDDFLRSRNT